MSNLQEFAANVTGGLAPHTYPTPTISAIAPDEEFVVKDWNSLTTVEQLQESEAMINSIENSAGPESLIVYNRNLPKILPEFDFHRALTDTRDAIKNGAQRLQDYINYHHTQELRKDCVLNELLTKISGYSALVTVMNDESYRIMLSRIHKPLELRDPTDKNYEEFANRVVFFSRGDLARMVETYALRALAYLDELEKAQKDKSIDMEAYDPLGSMRLLFIGMIDLGHVAYTLLSCFGREEN